MGRSARIALGTVAAAVAADQVGSRYLAAAIALVVAALLLLGEMGAARRSGTAWPVVVGAGLITLRLAVGSPGPPALTGPPPGEGPWDLVVLATGSPRAGHQSATLGTPPGSPHPFAVAATLPRYPDLIAGDQIGSE